MPAYRAMNMEFRQLTYFLAVAEDLQFSSAATRLGIAQSTLSEQIRALERQLGARLFVRTTRTVDLTPVGVHLVNGARQILTDMGRLQEEIIDLSAGRRGNLRIGAIGAALTMAVPLILRKLKQLAPEIDIRMEYLSTTLQIQEIVGGRLDVGFVRGVEPRANLNVWELLKEPLVAILSNEHPLAHEPSITLRQLTGQPFVFWPRDTNAPFYDQIIAICHEHHCVPSKLIQTSDVWTQLAMISAGFGVSVHPRSFLDVDRTDIVFVALEDSESSVSLQMIWSPTFETPALRSLLRAVEAAKPTLTDGIHNART